jgi:hypothetical protein
MARSTPEPLQRANIDLPLTTIHTHQPRREVGTHARPKARIVGQFIGLTPANQHQASPEQLSRVIIPALPTSADSYSVFDVACTGGTKPGSFNGHRFHRIPLRTPPKQSQQVSLAPLDRHDLRLAPPYPCTRMRRLLPQRALDLF